MKKVLMVLMVAVCAVLVVNNSVASQSVKDIKGTWDYKVSDAPYEYSTGKIIFGEAEGKVTAKVKFMDGTELKGQNVKVEKDSFSFGIYLEYDYVKVTGKVSGTKMTAKADTPEGEMTVTATKK